MGRRAASLSSFSACFAAFRSNSDEACARFPVVPDAGRACDVTVRRISLRPAEKGEPVAMPQRERIYCVEKKGIIYYFYNLLSECGIVLRCFNSQSPLNPQLILHPMDRGHMEYLP